MTTGSLARKFGKNSRSESFDPWNSDELVTKRSDSTLVAPKCRFPKVTAVIVGPVSSYNAAFGAEFSRNFLASLLASTLNMSKIRFRPRVGQGQLTVAEIGHVNNYIYMNK